MNKRGNINIGLLVLLTIFACSAALLSFLTDKGKMETEVNGANFLNEVYDKETSMNFYLKDIGEKSTIESYDDFTISGNYVLNPLIDNDGFIKIDFLRSDLNQKFEEKISEKFRENLNEINLDDVVFNDFKEISLQNIKVSSLNTGKEISFEVKELTIKGIANNPKKDILIKFYPANSVVNEKPDFAFSYSPILEYKTNIENLGLESFEKIALTKILCESTNNLDEKKICFSNNLKNFNVDILVSSEGKHKITLISKKKFLINNELKNIQLKIK